MAAIDSDMTDGNDDPDAAHLPLTDCTILLGVSGGIAAYKAAALASQLVKLGGAVDVVMTPSAAAFVTPLTFEALTHRPVCSDLFEPGGGLLHLDIAGACDLVILAPATANTLAKYAHGIADNLLTTALLATAAPVLVAPTMEPIMWEHPATQTNIVILKERGVEVIGPETGRLASGKMGHGRMSEPETIAAKIAERLANPPLLA